MLTVVKKSKYRESFTAERLREVLHYDPETGVFTARYTHRKRKAGSVLGNKMKKGHLNFWFEDGVYLAHRLAWLYVYGEWPRDQIDHINHDPSDNRIVNLRECTNAENRQNIKPEGYGVSGRLGVVRCGGGWRASIVVNGVRTHLGTYSSLDAADEAYRAAKQETHEFFAMGVTVLDEVNRV